MLVSRPSRVCTTLKIISIIDKNKDGKTIIRLENNSSYGQTETEFLCNWLYYINEIANLAQETNCDITKVKEALASDERIGKHFLNAGIGYGGSCFPKDTSAIIHYANSIKVDLNLIKSARIVNENQKRRFIANILKFYNYNIENKVFCLWGLSFKPNTSDTREAPANTIIDTLTRYGATIKAYDPKAVKDNIKQFKSKEEAILSTSALIIATEWDEFKNPDFSFIAQNLADKAIFDARNIYINENLAQYGLKYFCIGKSYE